jgi:signal transduction histidine kinase
LIDNKDKTRLIFFTTLIVVSIFALELINYKLFTEIIIEENKIRVKYFVIIAITMMQTVLASNYMVNVADKNEEMLESEKQELASVNNNLDQLNNYIDQQNLFLKNELQQKTVELLEQQKNLNRALIAAEEKERKRLSRDLHDGLGLLLSTAKIKIQTFDLKNVEQNESLVEALELIDKSCIELRLISQNLTPTLISEIGLAASLEAIVGNINTSKFTQIELVIVGIEYIKWKSEDEVKVYRLILELINNCIKHANADLITVQIIYKNELLRLLVEDNGEGFSNKGIILGNGLKNTKAIVELFNGTIKIESNHKKGALIYIEIPYV